MSRKLTALVELGVPGGRTGARTFDEAMTVARAIATSKIVALSGLECYEGLQVNGDSARDTAMVGALMQRVKDVALACDAEKLFAGTAIILTAGGSAAFDIVARELPLRLSRPVLTILRSGCYVTHDSGFYNRMLEQVKARSGAAWQARAGLQPALEVWSRVQSCPEPGLAILTMGKRDASFDLDLPVPTKALPHRSRRRAATRAGVVENYRDERPARVSELRRWRCAAGRRSCRMRHLASVHDLRQMARLVHRRRRLSRDGRDSDVFLILPQS